MLQTPTVHLSSTTKGEEGPVFPRVECPQGTFYTTADSPGDMLY